jgi:hypothetical protein
VMKPLAKNKLGCENNIYLFLEFWKTFVCVCDRCGWNFSCFTHLIGKLLVAWGCY